MSLIVMKVGGMNSPRIKRVSVSKTPRYLSPASARCWTFVFTLNKGTPECKRSHDQLTRVGESVDDVHIHRIDQCPRCDP